MSHGMINRWYGGYNFFLDEYLAEFWEWILIWNFEFKFSQISSQQRIYSHQTINLSYRETFVTFQKSLKNVLHFYYQNQLYHLVFHEVGVNLVHFQVDSIIIVGRRANNVENGTIAQIASTVFKLLYPLEELGGGLFLT